MSTADPSAASRQCDHRVVLTALFAVYLGLLAWAVLWKLGMPTFDGGTRAVKLVPFVAGDGYGDNSAPEMVANVALFVPFGVYVGLLVRRRRRWWRVAAAAATLSAGFETLQFTLAVGSSDVTDVILNTAGAVVGVAMLAVVRRVVRQRTAAVLVGVCATGTVIALAAATVFAAGPLRYGPPPGDRPQLVREARTP